jgi:hypothetical protein
VSSGGAIAGLPRGWVDQLWHDMKAQGRARLAPVEASFANGRGMTDEHKKKLREGLQRYHERRRAAARGER